MTTKGGYLVGLLRDVTGSWVLSQHTLHEHPKKIQKNLKKYHIPHEHPKKFKKNFTGPFIGVPKKKIKKKNKKLAY
jgi:hypothetical protein